MSKGSFVVVMAMFAIIAATGAGIAIDNEQYGKALFASILSVAALLLANGAMRQEK